MDFQVSKVYNSTSRNLYILLINVVRSNFENPSFRNSAQLKKKF